MVEFLSSDHVVHSLVAPTFTENSEETNASAKPKISIKKTDDGVIINFDKKHGNGIMLFSKRSNEDEFELLSEVSGLSYLDSRPNTFNAPELREYMAYYVSNKIKVGKTSDIVLIIKK